MQKLFKDTRLLDKAVVEKYGLTEDIMMENAASALENAVFDYAEKRNAVKICNKSSGKKTISVLILTGSGNNGGDGYVLGRRIAGKTVEKFIDFKVAIFPVKKPKSPMCVIQAERAKKSGVPAIQKKDLEKAVEESGIIVDCIYGSGFHGELDKDSAEIIELINKSSAWKIACDIPSGIDSLGCIETFVKLDGANLKSVNKKSYASPLAFRADVTVTMGALKTALYSDYAKEFCGKIICADLGIPRELFENSDESVESEAVLLEETDLILPERKKQNTNKGSFGHTAIVCGEKPGAAIIAGSAAFRFGSGLVSLVLTETQKVPGNCLARNPPSSPKDGTTQAKAGVGAICTEGAFPVTCPPELMQAFSLPANTKAIAVGMGLGVESESAGKFLSELFARQAKDSYIPMIFDADMFSRKETVEFLEKSNADKTKLILTPHPKEFSSLLKMTGFGDFSVEEIVKNRISLCKAFVKNYPYCVILLKGANVCITRCVDFGLGGCAGSGVKAEVMPVAEDLPDAKAQPATPETYINPFGDSCLAKGGSGDVLAGLVAALLAQGFDFFEAAKNASLAHALASRAQCGSYSVTPFSLIEEIGKLRENSGGF